MLARMKNNRPLGGWWVVLATLVCTMCGPASAQEAQPLHIFDKGGTRARIESCVSHDAIEFSIGHNSALLDADDSLGQMIFHELCHSLIEGEDSFGKPDWGMDNTGPDQREASPEGDNWREHACLRLQWVLTGRYGLRTLFAPTTDFRAFWDQLSGDVLLDSRGFVIEKVVKKWEDGNNEANSSLVTNQNVSSLATIVGREANIINNAPIPVTLKWQPKGYPKTFAVTIMMTRGAANAA